MSGSRRGFALLLALAACLLILVSLGTWIQARHHLAQVAWVAESDDRIRGVRGSAEQLLQSWISSAPVVVLPSGGGSVLIADDALLSDGQVIRMTIRAYDVCAAIPAARAVRGDALVANLPPVLQGIRSPTRGPVAPGAAASLSGWIDTVDVPPGARRFPALVCDQPLWWGGGPSIRQTDATDPTAMPAVAVWISPHQEGTLNVNTMPMDLLRAVYQELALDGIDQVADGRAAGRLGSAPTIDAGRGIRLVDRSSAWAARIDVAFGAQHRAWWVVALGKPGAVRIVSRHVIGETS